MCTMRVAGGFDSPQLAGRKARRPCGGDTHGTAAETLPYFLSLRLAVRHAGYRTLHWVQPAASLAPMLHRLASSTGSAAKQETVYLMHSVHKSRPQVTDIVRTVCKTLDTLSLDTS